MGKNPKLWVLVRVRVLGKAGSVRVRVLCLPSKFGFGSGSSKSRVRVRFFKNRFGFFPISTLLAPTMGENSTVSNYVPM
jgi:hypothetical protein